MDETDYRYTAQETATPAQRMWVWGVIIVFCLVIWSFIMWGLWRSL